MYRGFIAALSRESEHRPGAPHQPPPRLVASEQLGGRFATRLILEIWRVAPSVRPMISSRALKNAKYERYCRLRASALPRIQVYREVGWRSREDDVAYINACRLERRSEIRDRIAYLSQQEEDLVAEKRRRIEEQLWEIHEADFGDCFETYEAAKVGKDGDGKMLTVRKQRPRLLSDLPPDLRKAIEHVQLDAKGNVVPQLYSKLQANQELRKMLNIGGQKEREQTDVSKLSDAELISQLL